MNNSLFLTVPYIIEIRNKKEAKKIISTMCEECPQLRLCMGNLQDECENVKILIARKYNL